MNNTLEMAIVQQNPIATLVGSMSRRGSCWDNAVIERFFLNWKMARVWEKDYASYSAALTDVADYIVSFYNSKRLHSKLGNLSPNAFERESATQPPINVAEIT
ncbi:MAG: putative transposase [Rhodoferax sp.]